jgi:hypothetical protein
MPWGQGEDGAATWFRREAEEVGGRQWSDPGVYRLTPPAPAEIANGAGAVRDKKILVFVLQMEESKQSTWMG